MNKQLVLGPLVAAGLTATTVVGPSVDAAPTRQPASSGMTSEAVAKFANPSIAEITLKATARDESGRLRPYTQTGTGFLFEGHVVTNCHVVSIPSSVTLIGPVELKVRFTGTGVQLLGRVLGCDLEGDLAVVHVGKVARPSLRFADPDSIMAGQQVMLLGFANATPGEPSVSPGMINGIRRSSPDGEFSDLIQHNATTTGGSSGGPLLNMRGEVVGVHTYSGNGFYYARSADTAEYYARSLIKYGEVWRFPLGLHPVSIDPGKAKAFNVPLGVLVKHVEDDSLAQQCDLRVNDIIYRIEWSNGYRHNISDVGSLNDARALIRPGQSIKVYIHEVSDDAWKDVSNHRAIADIVSVPPLWCTVPSAGASQSRP